MAKRDRLARDSLIAVLIEREAAKKGASSASGTGEGTDSDDPAATFTRRILDAVAELERSLTAARTRLLGTNFGASLWTTEDDSGTPEVLR
jgi:DNA invertase Pin-like site-specific DNA recombinase